MRVLTLSGTRTFNIVLRDYAVSTNIYVVNLHNEGTNVKSTLTITKTVAQIQANLDQLEVTVTDTYLEGEEFSFYVTGQSETVILHRNKLFFTSQIPQNYTINE